VHEKEAKFQLILDPASGITDEEHQATAFAYARLMKNVQVIFACFTINCLHRGRLYAFAVL